MYALLFIQNMCLVTQGKYLLKYEGGQERRNNTQSSSVSRWLWEPYIVIWEPQLLYFLGFEDCF